MHIHRDKTGQWVTDHHFDEWEKVIDKGHIAAWRKPVANSYLYEYKGRLCHDISVVFLKKYLAHEILQNFWREKLYILCCAKLTFCRNGDNTIGYLEFRGL